MLNANMDTELVIIKKAWEVKDPTIWESESSDDNWQTVYAETVGEAKSQCSEKDKFLNIKARRTKLSDIVLFEGYEIARGHLLRKIADEGRKEQRRNSVLKFPETEMFYIQNGYVGNSVMWWGVGGAGYTSDITKAQKYTRTEVLGSFVNGRKEDRIWAASHIETKIKQHVDCQGLDSEKYES
jgi:hypothetical protein